MYLYMFIAVIVAFIIYVITTTKERDKLIELLAAKDYSDYKNFNLEKEEKKHKNLYISRENKQKE